MKRELFEKIFDDGDSEWKGDNAFHGLLIIAKYFDGYFGEVDHLIPWQIDQQISWRPEAINAVEAMSKLVNKNYNYR
jgi:hypothetical protein